MFEVKLVSREGDLPKTKNTLLLRLAEIKQHNKSRNTSLLKSLSMNYSVLRVHKPTLLAIKIMKKADSKNRYFRLALKGALACSLATALMSCGGDVTSATDSNSSASPAASASAKTAAALATFWGRYGAKESFTPMYVDVLTKLLEAEDKVFAADYKGARVIVDALIAKYPLMDNN